MHPTTSIGTPFFKRISIHKYAFLLLLFLYLGQEISLAQLTPPELSVSYIMRDPKWIGTSPSNVRWSDDSKKIYFNWNPEKAQSDSLYSIAVEGGDAVKVPFEERKHLTFRNDFTEDRSQKIYERYGDLFIQDMESGQIQQLTFTQDREGLIGFVHEETAIAYVRDNNIFLWEIASGITRQITDFRRGMGPKGEGFKNSQKEWVEQEELKLIQYLKEQKEKREASAEAAKRERPESPESFYYGSGRIGWPSLSPDGKFVSFRVSRSADAKQTKVPDYIQSSSYTEERQARPKVGSPQSSYTSYLYDKERDTVLKIVGKDLPGFDEEAAYIVEYREAGKEVKAPKKKLIIMDAIWSETGSNALVIAKSLDYKDRWICLLDKESGELKSLDHQHDEAWIDGPGIGRWTQAVGTAGWMPDGEHVYFQSEESGYSHLYTVNINTGKKKALTKGKFEVFGPIISQDKTFWYFTSSELHPGERHLYKMPIDGGKAIKLTSMSGNNNCFLSPDESHIAILHSSGNRPWELFIQKNEAGAEAKRLTNSLSEEFLSYPWREPEYITFKARDKAKVHARLYRPENPEANGPAVIFVHGAGYLQNAHKWWSSYFREYMFHNLLVDKGYTVLDMDFRASAGYGRDWRTAVYRYMGSWDLWDQVDGAKMLVDEYDVDAERIGIYGGSYGGFITLMAMFTEPEVFRSGAALRPVTDWAHYNHNYTASMLNQPQDDSLAYVRSSPIYHAEGLVGSLLICHGMVDTNVHFQDVVRLAQRLIELGKENWEVAMYPVEGHGFREPSSWTDEYRRIFKLFEDTLK
ncbi:MAG: prolyl oligopeptidase family serine peptidase [Bacteroidia bacterium]|nr:prolyl oligopeptidase family serine peptidase [Bacteroidia bacterium]